MPSIPAVALGVDLDHPIGPFEAAPERWVDAGRGLVLIRSYATSLLAFIVTTLATAAFTALITILVVRV